MLVRDIESGEVLVLDIVGLSTLEGLIKLIKGRLSIEQHGTSHDLIELMVTEEVSFLVINLQSEQIG